MIYTTKGKIKLMTQVETGVSKSGFEWANMTLVLSVPASDQLDRIFEEAFRVDADHLNAVQAYKVGDDVTVTWFLACREWNGRWFTDAKLLTINGTTTGTAVNLPHPAPRPLDSEDTDLPF